MALAFFVCGLQLVFLTNHLPTYLAVCGVDPAISALALSAIGFFNIIGCYTFGWLGGRYPKQWLLGGLYVARSLAIGVYFSLPATATSTLIFAAVMGRARGSPSRRSSPGSWHSSSVCATWQPFPA